MMLILYLNILKHVKLVWLDRLVGFFFRLGRGCSLTFSVGTLTTAWANKGGCSYLDVPLEVDGSMVSKWVISYNLLIQ